MSESQKNTNGTPDAPRPFGIPGIGGSLGCCAYCGENFLFEILTNKTVKTATVGGQTMALHKDCIPKLLSLLDAEGYLEFKQFNDLPAKSPLGREMKQLWRPLRGIEFDNEV